MPSSPTPTRTHRPVPTKRSPHLPPRLTGPYDTRKLRTITAEEVTVTVSRVPRLGHAASLRSGLEAVEASLRTAPGFLGAGLFVPQDEIGPYQLVVRFASPSALAEWEHSDTRHQLLDGLATHVAEVAVATAHTPQAFFDGQDALSAAHPLRKLIHDGLWATPVSLLSFLVISPLISALDLALRIAICIVVGTGLSVFVNLECAPGPANIARATPHFADTLHARDASARSST
jgi:antibiotic biosynthesis monooxygenase (ABM) superfamily enzyme